ncbi:hypothetical protein N7523_010234 [Penicillium sp. IBT 18751x]|nr:hypothetical protein N7523_010234 [Penicillium sp. IBT 18751x]
MTYTRFLDALPPEIISLIAQHLRSTKDYFAFLRANKNIYSILIAGFYKNNVKSDGGSALTWYASRGNEAGVKEMLAAGADVNIRPLSREQSTGLLEATTHDHTDIVRLLLENGASADSADLRSRRPLTQATSGRSDIAITKLLLKHGAQANSIPSDKHSPLMEAIRSSQETKATLLLKYGADPHVFEGRQGMNILHVAASKNASTAMVKMILKCGILIDSQDQRGRTPLQIAAENSCTRAVQVLLQYGANPNFQNLHPFSQGWTALFYAICPKSSRNDNKTIIRTLVMNGGELEARSSVQETPLLHAISKGAIKQAKTLLEAGSNIMARNSDGETALHLAASSARFSFDMISWLTESGADVNWVGGKKHETPIFYSIRQYYGHFGLDEALDFHVFLSLGADMNFQNINGLSPLGLAVRMGSVPLAKFLLEHGAFVNSKDRQRKTPLHLVLDKGSSPFGVREMVRLLIQHGADVNSRDCSGYTPLHSAVTKSWTWETAALLLEAGADRCAMTDDGKFPYDMIVDGPWAETQRLLLRHYPV